MEQRMRKLEDRMSFIAMILGKVLEDKAYELSEYDKHRMQELAKKGAHVVEKRDKEDEARRRYEDLKAQLQVLEEDFGDALVHYNSAAQQSYRRYKY